jgi:hypothetical protein
MKFDLLKKDPQSKARAGSITTDHGVIETPILCPYCRLSKRGTSKGIERRYKSRYYWETPIIYIYAHKWISWRSRWFINS